MRWRELTAEQQVEAVTLYESGLSVRQVAKRFGTRPGAMHDALKRRTPMRPPLVVLERADGVCGICGEDVEPLDYHVDHIVPLSLGGEHSYANTQPAHPVCNLRKGRRMASAITERG